MTIAPEIGSMRLKISIHMPHTWHDVFARYISAAALFQSTCHIRGMTIEKYDLALACIISIHMPHTWHDVQRRHRGVKRKDFNPHATYVA